MNYVSLLVSPRQKEINLFVSEMTEFACFIIIIIIIEITRKQLFLPLDFKAQLP